jgi:serine/threonine protein kinase
MNPVAACPSRLDLERLMQGQMPYTHVEQLAEHLEGCDACVKIVQALQVEDTLAELIRNQAKAQGKPPDAALKNLMERLRGLRTAKGGANTGTSAELSKELYDFLAPPQGPGELGRLGQYRVLKVLGAGGMGVVFQAEDMQLKRVVALKAMRPALAASPTAKQRFVREAQAAAALKHAHIITIYQVGEDRSVPFLAMEYLQGASLDDYLKRGKQPTLGQILRVGREVAEGLIAAHQRGLMHRDIKPGNIWLQAPKGEVKILDFGLARAINDDSELTQSGAIVGTPTYMAPEQAKGERTDQRADLYSLGCVLYRMCTGQLPFKGDTMAVLMALATENPKPVRELNPTILPALADLVMKLLSKRAEDRYQSAKEVVSAIQAIERGQQTIGPAAKDVTAGPSETPNAMLPQPKKRYGRRFYLLASVGLSLQLIAAGLLVVLVMHWMKGEQTGRRTPESSQPVAVLRPTIPETKQDDELPKDKPGNELPKDKPLPAVSSLTIDPLEDVTLKAGETQNLLVKIERQGFTGPVLVVVNGLPVDIGTLPITIEPNATVGAIRLQAMPGAGDLKKNIEIVASSGKLVAKGSVQLTVKKADGVAVAPKPMPGISGTITGTVTGTVSGQSTTGSGTTGTGTGLTGTITGTVTDRGGSTGTITGTVTATGSKIGTISGTFTGSVSGKLKGTATGTFTGKSTGGANFKGTMNGTVAVTSAETGGGMGTISGTVSGCVGGGGTTITASLNGKVATDNEAANVKPPDPMPMPAPLPVIFQKQDPPDKAKQAETSKFLRDVYKQDFTKKAPAERLALARKLLSDGTNTRADPVTRYVLFAEALELAVELGDVATALAAIERLEQEYCVDVVALKLMAFSSLGKVLATPTPLRTLAEAALAAVDDACEVENFEAATRFVTLAENAVKKVVAPTIVTRLESSRKYIEECKRESEAAKTAAVTLKEKPTDPEASLVMGKYLCFHKSDWTKALPLLSNANDQALSALANEDQANPTVAQAQVELGDGWWDLADAYKSGQKLALLKRAVYWYQQAETRLDGVTRERVEKRITIVQDQLTATKIAGAKTAVRRLDGHKGKINAVVFLADNRVITASGDETVRIWDAKTGKDIGRLPHDRGQSPITSMGISRDGKRLLACTKIAPGLTAHGCAWEIETLKSVWSQNGSNLCWGFGAVDGMRFNQASPRNDLVKGWTFGSFVTFVTKDGSIELHDMLANKLYSRLSGHSGEILAMAVSPDGRHLVSCGSDKTVRLWDTANSQELRRFRGHTGWATCVAISDDNRKVITGGDDMIIRVYDSRNPQELFRLTGHTGLINCLAFSPDGNYAVSGSSDLTVRIWDLRAVK